MTILIAGGTGFLGAPLVESLASAGHRVIILSRNAGAAVKRLGRDVEIQEWDPPAPGRWASQAARADAVINLVGEPLDAKRWTAKQKERIALSRVDVTRALVQALGEGRQKPATLINASAVGYYDHSGEDTVTENSSQGKGFLADVCGRWEAEALKAKEYGVRTVLLRTGVVMSAGGGVLKRMVPPFRFFVGGPIGSGDQWVPWVHRADLIGVVHFVLSHPDLAGPINVVAPEAVSMRQLCEALGRFLRRPSWLRVPSFVIRLVFGEMGGMILRGQRVVPHVLQTTGYTFLYPSLAKAFENIFA